VPTLLKIVLAAAGLTGLVVGITLDETTRAIVRKVKKYRNTKENNQ
jgi:hypothetical protein